MTVRNMTGANVPSLLEKTDIAELVNYWSTQFLDEFPLLSLFPEKVRNARQFMWEIATNLNVVGEFSANPGPGKRRDYARYSAAIAQVFYQSYIWSLTTEQNLLLRSPGDASRLYGSDSVEQAETSLNEAVREHVRIYWRTLHNRACAKILSEQTPTITIDGVSVTVDFGIGYLETDSDWTNPASDVLTEMNTIVTNFTRENENRKPNVMIRPPFFHRDVILKNTELRENFAPYMAGIMKGAVSPFNLLVEPKDELKPGREIVMNTMEDPVANDGDYADKTEVWPDDVFTLMHFDSGEENLQLNTSRDLDNDMRGGIGSYTIDGFNPKRTDVVVAGNHVPTCKRPNRILIVKYTGA